MITTKEQCIHNLPLKQRSIGSIVRVKPLFNYDSQNIIVANGTDIHVFSIKSGECIQTLKYHTRHIISLQICKKNILQILSCSDDGVIVRWDYTGKILKVYELKTPVFSFYAPSADGNWFITKKHKDYYCLYSVTANTEEDPKFSLILKRVQTKTNAIGFDPMGKYVASVIDNNLSIYVFDAKKCLRVHKTGERKLTCVACHPSKIVIATGDTDGRVIVWTNALESNQPIRSIYHWHSLPLGDVTFSSEGYHVFSAGGECCLVKWSLFSEDKYVLPRMGAPIDYIVPSKDNSYIITTHTDSVIQVTDAEKKIVQVVIEGLTKSQALYGKVLSIGLLYNAHLKALVMNGKPGYLQFYDTKQDRQMFHLDIASKNFMTQERETAVFNIDVLKAAVDDSGFWLATTEYWCNNDTSPQIWLKFWEFNLEKQVFVLNTNVYMPHNKELNNILFRPSVKHSNDLPLAVTTGIDTRFKIWTLFKNKDDFKQSWSCEFTGYYRDMIPTSASFSEDGSVLAVAFGCIATLWKVEGLILKAVLLHKKSERSIKQLLFGRQAGFKYLICHDGFSITAWDCVSLSVAWMVNYEIQLLVSDVASDNIAAFCKDQNLKIFKPKSPQPLDYVNKVSDSTILSAVFVPSETCNNVSGCFSEKSQLFFMDESQNLFTLLESAEQEEVGVLEKRVLAQFPETPFGLLQAEQKASGVKKEVLEKFDVNLDLNKEKIISNPTWQDPTMLLKLLPNLLVPRNKEEDYVNLEKESMDRSSEVEYSEVVSIKLEEDWLTKSFSDIKLRVEDFSFLTKNVKFTK